MKTRWSESRRGWRADKARLPATSGGCGAHGQEQLLRAEHVDHPLEIIAEHAKRQFRPRLDQSPDQESRIAHHPFYGSERMLGQALPQIHPFAITHGAVVHGLSGIFVEAAHDGPLGGRSALRLEGSLLTGLAVPVLLLRLSVGHLAHAEHRPGRALIAIGLGIVAEAVATKILFALRVDRLRPWHDGGDLRLLTALAVLAVRIAGVRDHGEALDRQRLLALFGHRLEQPVVIAFVGQIKSGNQMVRGVHRDLRVVGNLMPMIGRAHQPGILLADDTLAQALFLHRFRLALTSVRRTCNSLTAAATSTRSTGVSSSCLSASSI